MSALGIIMAVLGVLLVSAAVWAAFGPRMSPQARRLERENRERLSSAQSELRIAKRALLKIASGASGSPELDAQLALEEIGELDHGR